MADLSRPSPGRRGPGEPARRPGQPGNQRETDALRKPESGSPATTSRLREDIDHGAGADKIDYPDPSAAPLGTDDEAAGLPPSAARVALASRQKLSDRPPDIRRPPEGAMRLEIWILITVVMLAILAVIVWWGMP
jgi:hypothetical protein